ncbi:MAG: hypothetical protein ACFFD4_06885 [Candidatus Odinarchaeota archaeon]
MNEFVRRARNVDWMKSDKPTRTVPLYIDKLPVKKKKIGQTYASVITNLVRTKYAKWYRYRFWHDGTI